MKIKNINIQGGNQQFADTIINSSTAFDENDKKIIQLIHDNFTSSKDRQILLKELETIKSPTVNEEEKVKSGSLIRKFFDSVATESGKTLIEQIAENSADYIQYLQL